MDRISRASHDPLPDQARLAATLPRASALFRSFERISSGIKDAMEPAADLPDDEVDRQIDALVTTLTVFHPNEEQNSSESERQAAPATDEIVALLSWLTTEIEKGRAPQTARSVREIDVSETTGNQEQNSSESERGTLPNSSSNIALLACVPRKDEIEETLRTAHASDESDLSQPSDEMEDHDHASASSKDQAPPASRTLHVDDGGNVTSAEESKRNVFLIATQGRTEERGSRFDEFSDSESGSPSTLGNAGNIPAHGARSSSVSAPAPSRSAQATCCDAPVNLLHSLRAGLASLVGSSGYAIFGKDIPEAIFAAMLIANGLDPTSAPYSYMIATICGAWYGGFHQVVSKFTAGLMNSFLGVTRYSPRGNTEFQRQARELFAMTIPGLVTYTIAHAIRGYLTEEISDPWTLGGSKFLASCIAGGLTGVLTDLICQSNPEKFRASQPEQTFAESMRAQMASLREDLTARKVGHDYLGKIVGSVGGMLAAVPIAPLDLPGATTVAGLGAAQGALGKAIYQAGFYAGIHLLSAAGNAVDVSLTRASAQGALDDVITDVRVLPLQNTQTESSSVNDGGDEEDGALPTREKTLRMHALAQADVADRGEIDGGNSFDAASGEEQVGDREIEQD